MGVNGVEGDGADEHRWCRERVWVDWAGASGVEASGEGAKSGMTAGSGEIPVCVRVRVCAVADNKIGDAGAADIGRGLAGLGSLKTLKLNLFSTWPVKWRVHKSEQHNASVRPGTVRIGQSRDAGRHGAGRARPCGQHEGRAGMCQACNVGSG